MAKRSDSLDDRSSRSTGRRRPRLFRRVLTGVIVIAVLAGGYWGWQRYFAAGPQRAAGPPPGVPVTVASVATQDVPIYLEALGTVQAYNTVAVRAQVDGKIQAVNFTEGQVVKKGEVLAQIDQRSFQASRDQAIAKKAQDQALLAAAQKDLVRFTTLAARNVETQQNVDTQRAKVDQLSATVDADQAAIEGADTQFSYTSITAPIDGRVGFRQVDVGNIIHANDQNPLTVLTQIRPSLAIFTLPQKDLGRVREAMLRGAVTVQASDQDGVKQLAEGELLLIDNQIDQSTSTIRMKARFPNEDDRLWPGEFVKVRLLVDTRKNAVTMPAVAVQRGPQGLYTWVVKDDNTVDQRPVDATVINDVAMVRTGVNAGDRVVVNGQYRLQSGSRVDAKPVDAAKTADKTPS